MRSSIHHRLTKLEGRAKRRNVIGVRLVRASDSKDERMRKLQAQAFKGPCMLVVDHGTNDEWEVAARAQQAGVAGPRVSQHDLHAGYVTVTTRAGGRSCSAVEEAEART